MQIPTIHLNGTSYDALIQEYQDAIRAVDNARDKLAAVTVHGRDYYVQPVNGYPLAQAEHTQHLEMLGKISAELHEVYFGIVRQENTRQAKR